MKVNKKKMEMIHSLLAKDGEAMLADALHRN
jgi:hypothetical protein